MEKVFCISDNLSHLFTRLVLSDEPIFKQKDHDASKKNYTKTLEFEINYVIFIEICAYLFLSKEEIWNIIRITVS